jgi:phosphate transport system protein
MLTEKIEKLKVKIISFASLTESMLRDTETAVYTRDNVMGNNIITHFEQLANRMELENETLFIEFLALFQPEATDLRTVISLLKINNNLERIADHCVNIVQRISSFTSIKNLGNLKLMFNTIQQMFKDTFNSFINNDTNMLLKIIEQDKVVDEKLKELTSEVIGIMDNYHAMSNNAISALLIGRDLERIGDLTVNICEDIIYMTKGDVIKHSSHINF